MRGKKKDCCETAPKATVNDCEPRVSKRRDITVTFSKANYSYDHAHDCIHTMTLSEARRLVRTLNDAIEAQESAL